MKNARPEKIEIVFVDGTLDAPSVALDLLELLSPGTSDVKLYGETKSAKDAVREIARGRRSSFNIDTLGETIHFSTVKAYKLHSLEICRKARSAAPCWVRIAELFLSREGFTQACVSDVEYVSWQNARDPIQYEAAGRSWAGLPMISNGLPKPLEKLVIDVSSNPSRRELRVGFVEMIGHLMWFGSRFWTLVGERARRAIATDEAYVTEELPFGIVKVERRAGPFFDNSTVTEQANLRRSLFESGEQGR